MQRALRSNIMARNQSLKSTRRKNAANLKETQHEIRNSTVELSRLKLGIIKAERKHRREDWILGPLAPNRLVGKNAGSYGQLEYQAIDLPPVLESERAQYFNFAVNDRVVVRTGREKGKIGKITEVNEEKQTVTLEDVNMVDVKVPAIYRSQSGLTTPFTAYPKPLLIKDIALVVPLRDRATRKVKDTVVKHLRGGAPFPKPTYGSATPRHTRYIAGHDIPIPWPEDETPEKKDEDSDTLRIDVDDVSFSPSVDHIPMPESLIDELRNKYSRTRKVHTEEYIQQKMKEDAEEQWKRRRRMVLPQQEYWEQKQKQKQQETLHNPKIMANTLSLITKEVQAARKGKKRLRVAL